MTQNNIKAFLDFISTHDGFHLIASNSGTFYRYISNGICAHQVGLTYCNGIIKADELNFVELNYPEYFI